MTTEQMTPEEEVRLRLAAGISPSTPTEYMLKHIPLWVKMSILRRNTGVVEGGGGDTPTPKKVTTYDFTTNTYRKNGSTVSLGDVSEFIRLSSATMWQDGNLVEVQNNIPRISNEGLMIEPQRTNYSPRRSWEEVEGATTEPSPRGLLINGQDIIRMALSTHLQSRIERSILRGVSLSGPVSASSYVISESEGYVHYGFGPTADVLGVGGHPVGNTWSRAVYTTQDGIGTTYEKYVKPRGPVSLTFDMTCNQLEENAPEPSSFIPTTGVPVSRSPDILNIPLLPTQTITGDWDAGVTYSVAGGIATFVGHGYIRNITVEAL